MRRRPAGPKPTYRCVVCGYTTKAYARIERHMDDEHGGGRIATETEGT